MERFSTFNDPRSGVNPFTQPPYKPGVLQLLGGSLLGLLRLPAICACLLALAITSWVSSLIPIGALARLNRLVFERAASRVLLWLLGFFAIPTSVVHKGAIRVRPSKSHPGSAVQSGDIIIANKCSYVDVLYLSAAYAPTFTATSQDGGLRALSLFEALRQSVRGAPRRLPRAAAAAARPAGASAADEAALAAAAEQSVDAALVRALDSSRGGPLVVFPEGAPTNNRAVLMFTPVADQLARAVVTVARGHGAAARLRVPTVHVLALRYAAAGAGTAAAAPFSPCFTAGRPLLHAWHLVCQPSSRLEVLRLPEGFDPQPADFAVAAAAAAAAAAPAPAPAPAPADAAEAAAAAAAAPPATWSIAVRDAMAQLLRGSRAVALGAAAYDAFLDVAAGGAKGDKAR